MCALASAIIFIPGQLLCSVVLASAWGAFLLLLSFSSSSWGVFNTLLSFSSSLCWDFLLLLFHWDYEGHGRIIALATCFGGLCFYSVSVTHEVQDVSSLAATSLTNVRVLPLMVSSHPSLLGSSRDVLGGAAPPPCSRWVLFFSVYCPRSACGCGACASSSPCSCWSYPSSRRSVHFTRHQVWQ